MGALRRFLRGVATALMFILFAVGGMAVSAVVLFVAPSRRRSHLVVRSAWRGLISAIVKMGLISVDATMLSEIRGRIIVANHPSLIDVVILTACIPNVYSIAKKELKSNPFIGLIVKRVMIPNDDLIVEASREILSCGGNILIFPEGTRTPIGTAEPKLKRGAAQLAIRLGVAIVPVRILTSRRILAKGQSILDMGENTVQYRIISAAEIKPPLCATVNRAAAMAMTAEISKALFPPAEFSCRRCGACCRIEGFVRLDERDIENISRHLSMDAGKFIDQHTRLAPDRKSLALKDRDDGSCAMLDGDNRCRIYPVRPEKCRTFPYAWTNPESCEYCPGLKALFE